MYFLVISLCSHDFIVMSLSIYNGGDFQKFLKFSKIFFKLYWNLNALQLLVFEFIFSKLAIFENLVIPNCMVVVV